MLDQWTARPLVWDHCPAQSCVGVCLTGPAPAAMQCGILCVSRQRVFDTTCSMQLAAEACACWLCALANTQGTLRACAREILAGATHDFCSDLLAIKHRLFQHCCTALARSPHLQYGVAILPILVGQDGWRAKSDALQLL